MQLKQWHRHQRLVLWDLEQIWMASILLTAGTPRLLEAEHERQTRICWLCLMLRCMSVCCCVLDTTAVAVAMMPHLEEPLLRQRHHKQFPHFLRPGDVRGQVRVHVVVEIWPPVLPDALADLRKKPQILLHQAHGCHVAQRQPLRPLPSAVLASAPLIAMSFVYQTHRVQV